MVDRHHGIPGGWRGCICEYSFVSCVTPAIAPAVSSQGEAFPLRRSLLIYFGQH